MGKYECFPILPKGKYHCSQFSCGKMLVSPFLPWKNVSVSNLAVGNYLCSQSSHGKISVFPILPWENISVLIPAVVKYQCSRSCFGKIRVYSNPDGQEARSLTCSEQSIWANPSGPGFIHPSHPIHMSTPLLPPPWIRVRTSFRNPLQQTVNSIVLVPRPSGDRADRGTEQPQIGTGTLHTSLGRWGRGPCQTGW
jgi:hypothetical protein